MEFCLVSDPKCSSERIGRYQNSKSPDLILGDGHTTSPQANVSLVCFVATLTNKAPSPRPKLVEVIWRMMAGLAVRLRSIHISGCCDVCSEVMLVSMLMHGASPLFFGAFFFQASLNAIHLFWWITLDADIHTFDGFPL